MTDFAQHLSSIAAVNHAQPYNVLGLQKDSSSDYLIITALFPDADEVALVVKVKGKNSHKTIAKLAHIEGGVFSKKLRRKNSFDYQFKVTYGDDVVLVDDPYAFGITLPDFDLYLLREGNHESPHKVLGAHQQTVNGVKGVSFTVWAPSASAVSLVGDFNHWDGRRHLMHNVDHSGFWNIFIPGIGTGAHYKFEIKSTDGHQLPLKADPCGQQAQYRPETASVVASDKGFKWSDAKWLKTRELANQRDAAISIYEVHLGSWKRGEDNRYLTYRELAEQLVPYVVDMGFTHIQLMPVSEYPYDGSWGYQPVGLFAPTARFGTPEDFKFFVNACHKAGVGLLIDWVPGHFPSDAHGLGQFDGSHLYEHADPRQGYHPDWNTLIYNYGRTEVANFLRASGLHWLEDYHVDGVRVDAVASMLYLDYSREHGEWIPNEHGGRENLEAVDFLQRFNQELYSRYPGTFSVAEESTSWPGVSRPVDGGGLGFGYKWNMGWMNDTLGYMERDPVHRKHHHNEISFGLVYAFDENFVLPLSHDEVVHGKGSILARMPGDRWQQMANLRAYYGFMWAHPGKKLLFMGSEFGQQAEWNFEQSLDWHVLEYDEHQQIQSLIRTLNNTYRDVPAMHELDCEKAGFDWIDYENADQSVFSFIRRGKSDDEFVVAVTNFTPAVHHNFVLGVPEGGFYQEILNTDAECFGGSNQGNGGGVHSCGHASHGHHQSISITVPPLSTVLFKWSRH